MARWFDRWLARHRHPVSLVLHVVAIPLLPLAGVLVVLQLADGAWALWWRPAGLLLGSYVLQWIGHRLEGSDMGELTLVKKWVGKSNVQRPPVGSPATEEPGSSCRQVS